MERDSELDVAGGTTITIGKTAALFLFVFFFFIPIAASGQEPAATLENLQTLFDQKQWVQILERVKGPSTENPDLNYYYGSAAAQLGQWQKARVAFLVGAQLSPGDPRFPIELGGVAFRQKRYAEAARWVRRGLSLDSQDAYANDFLATIYFISGNLEGAIKYWNRVRKPQIQDIQTAPFRVKPALLDRAFAFAPASTLLLPDLITTEDRLDVLGIFSQHSFRLTLRDDNKFDALLMAGERNGLNGTGNDKVQAAASALQGVFYDTIYLQYFNIRRSAINFNSLLRWDPQKRRIYASLSEPLRENPKYRLDIGTDLRNENWQIRQPATVSGNIASALNIRSEAVEAQFTSINNGKWNWSSGIQFSHRDYRNIAAESAMVQQTLIPGYELKHFAKINYRFLRVPEHRFSSTASFSAQTGTIGSRPVHAFEKLEAGVKGNWYPNLAGDDWYTQAQIRVGKTFGQVPFDELYMLGLERDTELLMRAHLGAQNGFKGSAPIGRNYFLSNTEADKKVYESGLVDVKLSPFLDTGKVTDPVPELGSRKWLFDTGMQLKFRVWGIGFAATYGKDLRSGRNTFFFTAGK